MSVTARPRRRLPVFLQPSTVQALGVTASVLTNADGSQRLSLVSQSRGAAGQITIADSTNNPAKPTTLADSTAPDKNPGWVWRRSKTEWTPRLLWMELRNHQRLEYGHQCDSGRDLSVAITGTASSGETPETVQVVIDNDTSSIETAINTFVTDYNATMKAINAQEGKDSSGNPQPLYGTSVLAQLQEGLLSAMSGSFGTNAINSLISLGITANAELRRHHHSGCRQTRACAEQQLQPGRLVLPGYGQLWFNFHENVERSRQQQRRGRRDQPCTQRRQQSGNHFE